MKNFTNKRVAISGGAGFVGSNLIKYLNSNGVTDITIYDKLDTLDKKLHNILPLNFRSIEPHEKLEEDIYQYDWIILNGANSSTKTKPEDFKQTLEDNFYSTRRILRNFRNGINASRKLVFASSASTYGLSDDFTERTENICPQHLYGLTKLLIDREILSLINHYNSPQIYSFRYFNVAGADEKHKIEKGMSSPISRFLNQEPPYVLFRDDRGTKFSRDFIAVEDVAKVIYFALTSSEMPPDIYNLGSGVDTSWEDLLKIVCKIKGQDYDSSVQYSPLPNELKNQYQSFTRADVTKLRKYYKEPFMSVEEIVKKVWESSKK